MFGVFLFNIAILIFKQTKFYVKNISRNIGSYKISEMIIPMLSIHLELY